MDISKFAFALFACLSLSACASTSPGYKEPSPEELVKRQARSVHLCYGNVTTNYVSAATATVTVRKSAPGTYFAVLVWDGGYCGVQDFGENSRAVIFSVWDPVDPTDLSAQPDAVKEAHRAKVLYSDPAMDVARFGGEGSGARTMAGFSWQDNSPIRFKVEAAPDGADRTVFTCYLQDASSGTAWYKLASISTMHRPGADKGLTNVYSFIEDFCRNYKSAKQARVAEFSNVAVLSENNWIPMTRAFFSGDNTPSANVDAGKVAATGAFFLATGGETENKTTPLWQIIE